VLEINDHARNPKLIWQGIVARELVCNAASIAMRYPIAVLQLLGCRSQCIFAVKARQWRQDISVRKKPALQQALQPRMGSILARMCEQLGEEI
jgi:hypothetical protein